MGLENFGEKIEAVSFEKDFGELTEKEQVVKEKIKKIFQENAELNSVLLSGENMDFSKQQIIARGGQLKKLREEAREVIHELHGITGYEIPEDLRGIKAADNYYKEIREVA